MNGAAHAKLNLGLVVGPLRDDGMHEVVTVLQRLELADTLTVEPAVSTTVEGFPEDTLVTAALRALEAPHGWRVMIDKRIPVAAGLAGGSSDAATALRLASAQLERPVADHALRDIAASLGADVPFFLERGPQLGTGAGATLEPVELPQDFAVCLLLPDGAGKASTGAVYDAFDAGRRGEGFEARAAAFREALSRARAPRDLALLPANDLARSPHAASLLAAGAFRADVSGAGPVVYGLFDDRAAAEHGSAEVAHLGRCWVTDPAW
jgi:4-diphosphocytidyl-2-C-methyl-D-erythritol kinase